MIQVTFSPRDAVIQASLPPAREELCAFICRQPQVGGEDLARPCERVFVPIPSKFEQGEHAGLKVWNRHDETLTDYSPITYSHRMSG
jgi:hypothetical protein